MMLVHSVRSTSSKHWPIRLNSNGPLSFWSGKSRVKIFDLKSGSLYAWRFSAPNWAWSGVMWPAISLALFLKEILIRSSYFRPSLIRLSGMPSASKDIQQVYQLNWGLFCTLIRSDMVMILICLGMDHAWVLIANFLDCAGISPQQRTIVIVTNTPVDERISCWNIVEKSICRSWVCCCKVRKLFIMSYNSICLMCSHRWHILPPLALSYSENKNRQA